MSVLSRTEFEAAIAGKSGRIYVARKGTVSIFEMEDGNTYMINNVGGGGVVVNPVPQYWEYSIDWQVEAYFYFTFGVGIAESMPERAKMSLELTPEWIEKVETGRKKAEGKR